MEKKPANETDSIIQISGEKSSEDTKNIMDFFVIYRYNVHDGG